ncbi:MAG: hypothetical protein PHN49_02195 [Candidatus Omnitrophica bacterium]|nr:hypothetical protein [Candidatus Omnitrophota bacterium]MDD5670430.1 hypothetical protein [Candidatus Omnitrophota bacterium]
MKPFRLANRKFIVVSVLCGLSVLIVWGSFLYIAAYWTKYEIERRIKADIQGDVRPVLFQPRFALKNVNFVWKDKLKVSSGEVDIEYDAMQLISGELLRVKIQGGNIQGELLGTWSEIEGVKQVDELTLIADLGFGRHGLREIHDVEVNSPTLKFRIQEGQPLLARRLQKAKVSL